MFGLLQLEFFIPLSFYSTMQTNICVSDLLHLKVLRPLYFQVLDSHQICSLPVSAPPQSCASAPPRHKALLAIPFLFPRIHNFALLRFCAFAPSSAPSRLRPSAPPCFLILPVFRVFMLPCSRASYSCKYLYFLIYAFTLLQLGTFATLCHSTNRSKAKIAYQHSCKIHDTTS